MAEVSATITFPGGKRGTLTGPSREAIIADARALDQAVASGMTPREAASSLQARAIENVHVPALEPDRGAAGPPAVFAPKPQSRPSVPTSEALSRGGTESLLGNLSGLVGMVRPGVGAPALRELVDLPSGRDIAAGVEGLFTSETVESARERSRQAEREHPTAHLIGGLGGDALTLATGRVPLRRGIAAAERKLATPNVVDLQPGAKRLASRAVNAKGFRRLLRGAGRSVEAGAEGAFLASLSESSDPTEVAAYTAGSQALGSTLLTGTKSLTSGGFGRAGVKLGIAGASIAALIQTGKSLTPGGDNFSLESLESGFSKVALALAAGGLAGAVGAGRVRGTKLGDDLPRFMDFTQTLLQRGPAISAIKQWREDERVAPVMEKAAADMDYFKPEQQEALLRGFERGKLSEAIDELERTSEDFAARLDALTAELPAAIN